MATLVMKFGGAAVADASQITRIAEIILEQARTYPRIAVVVSAMGGTTDQLIELAKKVHPTPPKREQDMLISVGERISMTLLAMALIAKNKEAISFTGSQSGIVTCCRHSEARIIHVRPARLLKHLEEGKIVIVAGFQGVSREGEITTLGRGGSDITAVALGAALGAEKVEFYKDVFGICAEDPKQNPHSPIFSELSYEAALKITEDGARVLHSRSILLAQKNKIPLHVKTFLVEGKEEKGTVIGTFFAERNFPPLYEEE